MQNVESIRQAILDLHDLIRDSVIEAAERQTVEVLSSVAAEEDSDTIYAIDRVSEEVLVRELGRWAGENVPVVLVAEGLSDIGMVMPATATEEEARFRVIVDPIDGTRGLMYQKRSAWILTGVAPNRGARTSIADIELSVMTEIPLIKQHLSDQGWAIKGQGVSWERFDRLTGERSSIVHRPSNSGTIAHAFSTIFRPFPGARDILAALDDALVTALLGPQPAGKALCFEDQYASTGGQMFELAAGHDRFIADLRPLVHRIQLGRGQEPCICAHPYDACGILLATEAGVEITGLDGHDLDAPLDTTSDVGWIGYANGHLRDTIEPVLFELMRKFGLRD